MIIYNAGRADVAVIGAGHAGIEAALACAKKGHETVIFTLNLDSVGNMPCNPCIGGTAKGQLVYEIDALGGEMSIAADKTFIQSRLLNRGKGPAVQSKRVQSDRAAYRLYMKRALEKQPRLSIVQAEVVDIETVNDPDNPGKPRVSAVITALGARWEVKAVIAATGTYLKGKTIVGDVFCDSGPDGMLPSNHLAASLERLGLTIMRFKTGTPPRIHRASIDVSKLEIQYGDDDLEPFSALTSMEELRSRPQTVCYIGYTNEKTHEIIRRNIDRSPLYNGAILSTGPRYCPSIEDKVVRFADKERHPLFAEPCGYDTDEMYLQGLSSSMPADVQMQMLHSLVGFENAHVMRSGYAIEYDLIDSTQLLPTLEFKGISGFYGAGQFNGTSGYEEAAAQGLVAGVNASLKIEGKDPLILTRDSSYIGTLIDDLTVKGTPEPYRMMTSRSEYRLLLRQDNADERLCEIGRSVGLLDDARYQAFLEKSAEVHAEIERCRKTFIKPSEELNRILEENGTSPAPNGANLADLIKRPQLSYEALAPVDLTRKDISKRAAESAVTELRYEGYVRRERSEAEKFAKIDSRRLPQDIDYGQLSGLRLEARQKLNRIKPMTLGQASRISGVSPADITALVIYLQTRRNEACDDEN